MLSRLRFRVEPSISPTAPIEHMGVNHKIQVFDAETEAFVESESAAVKELDDEFFHS
jgi:hypothetical protein